MVKLSSCGRNNMACKAGSISQVAFTEKFADSGLVQCLFKLWVTTHKSFMNQLSGT